MFCILYYGIYIRYLLETARAAYAADGPELQGEEAGALPRLTTSPIRRQDPTDSIRRRSSMTVIQAGILLLRQELRSGFLGRDVRRSSRRSRLSAVSGCRYSYLSNRPPRYSTIQRRLPGIIPDSLFSIVHSDTSSRFPLRAMRERCSDGMLSLVAFLVVIVSLCSEGYCHHVG